MPSYVCSVCGRELSDPISIEAGCGPVCRAKAGGAPWEGEAANGDLYDIPYDPAAGDIVCRCDDPEHLGTCHYNFAQVLVLHSPTGMSWGYSGSGPADFALNALARHVGMGEAQALPYQDFKFRFVAGLPPEGGTIPGAAIRAWVEEERAKMVAQYGEDGWREQVRECRREQRLREERDRRRAPEGQRALRLGVWHGVQRLQARVPGTGRGPLRRALPAGQGLRGLR